jgi:hypothetical protein
MTNYETEFLEKAQIPQPLADFFATLREIVHEKIARE